jgi:cell division protein FtsA
MRDTICSIDIGSSFIRVLIGQHDGQYLDIVGCGVIPSDGVRAGSILNSEHTIRALNRAVAEAEQMSGLNVQSAIVNISGRSIQGENSTGVVAVTNRDRIVTEADVFRVVQNAQNRRIPSDHELLHVLAREFTVDDQENIPDPVGMSGVRLEVDVHVVTAPRIHLAGLQRVISGAGVHAEHVILSAIASAEAVLKPGEKEMGVAVVDIGGGVCDIAVFVEGGLFHTAVVPLGGTHVTNDLSLGLRISAEAAEQLKRSHGEAREKDADPTERVEIPSVHGRPHAWVLQRDIAAIIEPRMAEIFELVNQQICRAVKKNILGAGIVLTGGGSRLKGVADLACDIFGLPVMPALPRETGGLYERVAGPEFSTAVGMLLFAMKQGIRSHGTASAPRSESILGRIKTWLADNF